MRKIIEPLIAGGLPPDDVTYDDDVSYARDLGLIGQGRPIAVANPVYREVIVRVLGSRTEDVITASPGSFLLADGRLDFGKTLEEFAAFWRANGEILVKGEAYHEVAPQLVFMAFLQRIVNGGGFIDREYGVGRGRIDLLIRKPYTGADGKPAVQREAVELKVRRPRQGNPLREGLAQLDEYLSRLSLDSGTLVIFDRRPSAVRGGPRTEITRQQTPAGRTVTLLRA